MSYCPVEPFLSHGDDFYSFDFCLRFWILDVGFKKKLYIYIYIENIFLDKTSITFYFKHSFMSKKIYIINSFFIHVVFTWVVTFSTTKFKIPNKNYPT